MAGPVAAQDAGRTEPRFLRIGTGGQGGTYFPIGSLIARAVSDMPKGADCPDTRCGVAGLIAVAQTSNGSVSNVDALQNGEIEAALVQADVADWAFHGTALFAGRPPHDRLRFLAHLYSEAMHVVVRRDAGVRRFADLRGRPVALDEPGSGTLINVRNLLGAYGMRDADLRGVYIKPDLAMSRMVAGKLDAFFILAGWPAKAVTDAIGAGYATLLSLDDSQIDGLINANPFLSRGQIPAGAYAGTPAVTTFMVGAQLLVRADLPDDLVAGLLAAMWSDRGHQILVKGHPRGADIRLSDALTGRTLPLHSGATRFYREHGLLQ